MKGRNQVKHGMGVHTMAYGNRDRPTSIGAGCGAALEDLMDGGCCVCGCVCSCGKS